MVTSRNGFWLRWAAPIMAVALLAACTAPSRNDSSTGETSTTLQATTSPAGQSTRIDVRADAPFRVDLPGVATINGRAGSVAGAGVVVVQAVDVDFSRDGFLRSAGRGLDVRFEGTRLISPVEVSFEVDGDGDGEVPVVPIEAMTAASPSSRSSGT